MVVRPSNNKSHDIIMIMEGFRILEITQPSEIHVTANQLTADFGFTQCLHD